MNEREKLEKVINELEAIRDYDPMIRVAHDDVFKKYAIDALELLELLKAQEPRVMTPVEIGALRRGDIVWYEQHAPEEDYIQPMVADGGNFIGNADMGVKLCYLGPCERLWTAEPTDEQRRAVKWE